MTMTTQIPTPQIPQKRPTTQKAKGNKFERETARKLSMWMFGDNTVLYRHEDSGARKIVYRGDIIPKSLSKFTWSIFPFIIECKNGYGSTIPTLMNHNQLRTWLRKLMSEAAGDQRIPFFIAQYHHQRPILITNILLNEIPYSLAIALDDVKTGVVTGLFYVYDYGKVLSRKFSNVMPDWFESVIQIKPVEQTTVINETPASSEIPHDDEAQQIIDQVVSNPPTSRKPKKITEDDRQLTRKEQNDLIGSIINDIL